MTCGNPVRRVHCNLPEMTVASVPVRVALARGLACSGGGACWRRGGGGVGFCCICCRGGGCLAVAVVVVVAGWGVVGGEISWGTSGGLRVPVWERVVRERPPCWSPMMLEMQMLVMVLVLVTSVTMWGPRVARVTPTAAEGGGEGSAAMGGDGALSITSMAG